MQGPVELQQAGEDRVAVTAAGEPFTEYRSAATHDVLGTPMCYPIRTAGGAPITRGYPIDPRPNERVDHRNHVGLRMAYGDVAGYDFWRGRGTAPEAGRGHVEHRSIERTTDGAPAELVVRSDWIGHGETHLLSEETTYRFHAGEGERAIDRITRLTAERDVEFADDKEGLFALRTCRELEHPDDDETRRTDENGEPREEGIVHTEGVTGEYHSSEGESGLDVWGTRAPWMALEGEIDDEPVTVTIMDHPENPGHPTYWHARGYGLFAANSLGQAAFTRGERELGFSLAAGESATFRYRLDVDSTAFDADRTERRYDAFLEDVTDA